MWLWVPALLAGLVGYLVVTVNRHGSEGFGELPQFYVWAIIIAIQAAVWALVAAQGWDRLRRLRARFGHAASGYWPFLSWLLLALVIAGLVALLKLPRVGSPLAGHQERTAALTALGVLAATPSVVGIWRLQLVIARDIRPLVGAIGRGSPWSPLHRDVYSRLCDVRGYLQQFLAGLGAIVAALTFASGALRNAILAWQEAGGDEPSRIERQSRFDLPLEYVVMYGLFYTALVALIYVPVYGSLERTGLDLVDRVYPVPDGKEPTGDWQAGRDRLAKLLQLGFRAEDSLRSSVAIFAPLLATLVSTLLPGAG